MSHPPPCTRVGRQCRSLRVKLRVAELTDSDQSGDHEATWLLGHTEAIDFGRLDIEGPYLVADAELHVPCRFAEAGPGRSVRCAAYGFEGRVSRPVRKPADRKLGSGRFEIVDHGRVVRHRLSAAPARRRALPVIEAGANPCAAAPCRTADNRRGMACCRDLQIEIICPPSRVGLEALVRSRQSPYLCKVERESDDSLGAEMISACSFLAAEVGCSLHGLVRPGGRGAKPDLCFEWPNSKDNRHPGCVF